MPPPPGRYEVIRPPLPVPPAVRLSGRGLCGGRMRVEQPMARRVRLGRLGPEVQLAPGADGVRSGGGVRFR